MNKAKIFHALTISSLELRINSELKGELIALSVSQTQNGQYIGSVIYKDNEPEAIKLYFSNIKAYIERDGIRLVCESSNGQLSCGEGGGLMTMNDAINNLIETYKDKYVISFRGNIGDIQSSDETKPKKPKIKIDYSKISYIQDFSGVNAYYELGLKRYKASSNMLDEKMCKDALISDLLVEISKDYIIEL